MTKREARKIATLIEAAELMQTDAFGGVENVKVERQSKWLAQSLLRRYDLTWERLRKIESTPAAIRGAVLSGEL